MATQSQTSGQNAIDKLREACLTRGAVGIRGIGRQFRIYDDDADRRLDFKELKKGFRDYGVEVSDPEVKEAFGLMDADKDGTVSLGEFLKALRPPMSDARIKLIDMAFDKLDMNRDGFITVEDLADRYDVTTHNKYRSGEMTKKEVMKEFLDQFQPSDVAKDEKVTRAEFRDYYSGVSASIDQDLYFDLMMRQTWKL